MNVTDLDARLGLAQGWTRCSLLHTHVRESWLWHPPGAECGSAKFCSGVPIRPLPTPSTDPIACRELEMWAAERIGQVEKSMRFSPEAGHSAEVRVHAPLPVQLRGEASLAVDGPHYDLKAACLAVLSTLEWRDADERY